MAMIASSSVSIRSCPRRKRHQANINLGREGAFRRVQHGSPEVGVDGDDPQARERPGPSAGGRGDPAGRPARTGPGPSLRPGPGLLLRQAPPWKGSTSSSRPDACSPAGSPSSPRSHGLQESTFGLSRSPFRPSPVTPYDSFAAVGGGAFHGIDQCRLAPPRLPIRKVGPGPPGPFVWPFTSRRQIRVLTHRR
jgi:hypothetical protein